MGEWFLVFGAIFASVGFVCVLPTLLIKDDPAPLALPGPLCRCGDETVRETDGWLCVWCEEYVYPVTLSVNGGEPKKVSAFALPSSSLDPGPG